LPAAAAVALAEVVALDAAPVPGDARLEELDEPDEQAARPRPAARARAVSPPVCTALINVSFDTVI
jgi:hypothetical protein